LALLATVLLGGAASGATRTLTFGAVADTTVRADKPARAYATTTSVTADNAPVEHTLLRFTVTGVGTDVVAGASLRLYVTNPSPVAGTLYRVASQTWAENVTWTTAPAADPTPLASPTGKAVTGTWVTFNLAALVSGDGTYSVQIASSSNDGVDFASREGIAAQRPQIVVTAAPPPDVTAPTVSVTTPVAGDTVAGTVSVGASAQDDTAVTAVDVAIDGSVIGSDTTAPYTVGWDTLLAANGAHTVAAIAHDAAGHATTSSPVGVTVANATDTSPPGLPGNLLATVEGPRRVTLSWTASIDNVAVASYEVQRDGVVLTAVSTPGFVDTGLAQGSTVTYTVTAIDPSGNRSEPASVSATTPTAPTSFTFAAAGDHGANPKAAASLAALDASPAAFYLALGDMDYDQTLTDAAWCDYVHAGLPSKGAAFPFEVVSGNHEDDFGANGSILNHAACLPDRLGATVGPGAATYGTEYAFDYPAGAPLARFIMISPELTVAGTTYHYVPGNPHYDWLANAIDTAHAAGIPWVIVGMHFPCLSAGQYTCAAGPQLMNLLVAKHVDLVLHGHEHSYQRSKQLALDPTTCPSIPGSGYLAGCVVDDGMDGIYPKGAGSVDVIAGTFGQGLYNTYPADPESPYFVKLDTSSHGFMQYTVAADRIDAAFTKIDGTLQDSFSIVAGATASADRAAPTKPTALVASTATPGRVDLSWAASTDDAGIRNYAIFRDGLYVASTTATTFSDPSVASGGTYAYAVSAYDTAGNPSPMSDPAQVTVPQAATLTFGPDADASLYAASPTTNYGASSTLETDNSPVKQYLIRFTVSGVGTRTVTGATLRMSCVDPSPSGGVFSVAASNEWTESTVTFATAPAAGATVATLGKVVAGTNYVIDLSSVIHGDGTYTLRIVTANADGADFASKEGAIGSRPQLTVTTS
jgi:hypothetical protein